MKIAIAQMTSGIDPDVNADVLEVAIAQSAQGGADMLFTPEMSGLLDRDRSRAAAKIAMQEDDPVLKRTRAACAKHGIWASLGSLALKGGADGRLVNRSFVISAEGAIVSHYDKMHLFDVDLGSESWRESAAYAPGQQSAVVRTPVGRLGLSVCYDLRFPALYAALSQGGADMLSIPAAFTVPTGKAHWHVLMRARAIENACWVVAAAQCGMHEDGRETYGHSLVVNPWGGIVLDMEEGNGIGFAEIDLAEVIEARRRVPVLEHRRAIPKAVSQ